MRILTFLRHLGFGLLGLSLLPALAGMGEALYALLVATQTDPAAEGILIRFLLGAGLWLLIFLFLPAPFRSYVLAHELSHWLAALLAGARVGAVRVGRDGGSVEVSHTNLWITLAPYLIPFYSLLLLLGTALAGLWMDLSGWLPWLPPALGLTACYHLCFTVQALSVEQSDILPYGPLGAYPLILAGNLLLLLAGLIWISPLSFAQGSGLVFAPVAGRYRHVADFLLPLLQ